MLKVGHRGYLQLAEGFDSPRWREGLVIGLQKEWVQTIVRCSEEEVEQFKLTKVEVDSKTFALVEAEWHQLRSGVAGASQKLEVSTQSLLAKGKALLDSDEDLAYATASEPGLHKSTSKKKETSSSSSSSEESEVDLMNKMRQNWQGGSTDKERGSGSKDKARSSKRFSLLEKERRTSKEEKKDNAGAMLAAVAQSGDPLRGLLALQIAQTLKKQGRRKKSHRSRSSSLESRSSRGSSTTSSGSDRSRTRGHGKAVYNYKKSKKRMVKNPVKYIKRFVKGIEAELGAEDRPFKITDYNRRVAFGKQRNLQRCHYLVCVILDLLLRQDYKRAALQTVWTLQAMHQAALDQDWEIAWLLTHVEEPYKKRVFGGDPNALQDVASYLKSLNELSKSTEALRKKSRDDLQEGDGKGSGKGRFGKNGKNKDKDPKKENDQ